MKRRILTERDLDLIEVALDSAASACAMFDGRGGTLTSEYLTALAHVQQARIVRSKDVA